MFNRLVNTTCDNKMRYKQYSLFLCLSSSFNTLSRALQAGCKKPLFVRPIDDSFPKAGSVATMAALHALYVVNTFLIIFWRLYFRRFFIPLVKII